MPRPSQPDMQDQTDKDIHSGQGRDPYPSPRKGVEKASVAEDDTADPGDLDPAFPHDRGTVRNGKWFSGIETAEEQVKDDMEAWRKGLTQNEPPEDD